VPGKRRDARLRGLGETSRPHAPWKERVVPCGATRTTSRATFPQSPQGMKHNSHRCPPVEPEAQIQLSPRRGRHKMSRTSWKILLHTVFPEEPPLKLIPPQAGPDLHAQSLPLECSRTRSRIHDALLMGGSQRRRWTRRRKQWSRGRTRMRARGFCGSLGRVTLLSA
jgi:hypothetical protein